MMYVEESKCRICSGELKDVLDLGNIYPSTFLSPNENMSEDAKAPLVLAECQTCKLIQLRHTIDMDRMYRQYWYNSSLNKSMVSSLRDVVNDVEYSVVLKDGDTVIDIGCNDGTLLNLYSIPNLHRVGFDPALNISRPDNISFINEYFNAESYVSSYGPRRAKVITAIAMLYDLPDPNKFVSDVREILADDGIFMVQFTDLLSMYKVCAFDNICHEHLEYYRLQDVINILERNGLTAISVSYNDVNGGSLRVTAAHKGRYNVNEKVTMALVDEENFFKSHNIDTFKKCIDTTKTKIQSFLKWAKEQKKVVFLLGASTKGNTLLQVCDITSEQVPYAAEVNKEKFGLHTVGSNIEIISEEDALIKHPDYFIVPVWHFKLSILSNSRILDYMASNGRLVFPLPEFHVLHMNFQNQVMEARI